MDHDTMIATVHKYVEAFDKQDINIIRDIYAEDAVVEDPVGTEPYRGIEAICGFYETGLGAGANLELTGNCRCAGDSVAFPFQVVMGGMRIDIIDVFEFNEAGKVDSMKAYWSEGNMRTDG
jgi:steroid delta-isomerase